MTGTMFVNTIGNIPGENEKSHRNHPWLGMSLGLRCWSEQPRADTIHHQQPGPALSRGNILQRNMIADQFGTLSICQLYVPLQFINYFLVKKWFLIQENIKPCLEPANGGPGLTARQESRWLLYGNFGFNIQSRSRVLELKKCVITSIRSAEPGFCKWVPSFCIGLGCSCADNLILLPSIAKC